MTIDRRNFLKLLGLGSAVLVLGERGGPAHAADMAAGKDDFMFVQLSDTHWGFNGPLVNPDAAGTLKKAIAAVNSMDPQPDFIVFTGDITHTTDDPKERRKRLAEAREIISGLKNKNIKFLAGEHDAGLDNGAAFQEYFGKPTIRSTIKACISSPSTMCPIPRRASLIRSCNGWTAN